MTTDEFKKPLERLLNAVVEKAVTEGLDLRRLRGVALYDSQKDSFIKALPEFAVVESGIKDLDQVRAQYGIEQSSRITLQLVYEYFARTNAISVDCALLEKLWADFVTELDIPVWRTRGVTNLRHFQLEDLHVDLGDGVSIHGRNPDVLASLGFQGEIWERLVADWSGFGASSHILVAESTIPKRPDNFITIDNGEVWLRCHRAIGAMRLIAPGEVGISTTFVQRVAHFNVGIGGVHSTGATVQTIGYPYTWPSEQRSLYDSTYAALAHLERIGYRKGPGNLDLALRAFMSTYDRFPFAVDTKLVDSITALEAMLGTESEIAFKLSFRVASLLASSDNQRAELLKAVKGFYDTRSRIVHGGRPGKKQNEYLAAVDDLRDMVRRLLGSFVLFAADDTRTVPKNFFAQDLDLVLVDAERRESLRRLLGLDASQPPRAPNTTSSMVSLIV